MSNNMNSNVLLVGAGPMAEAYAAVLQAQQRPITVVGRGLETAGRFRAHTGIEPLTGGIESFCGKRSLRDYQDAIVAVGMERLADVTSLLLETGIKRVLVEKPAGMNRLEIEALAKKAKSCRADVYVAYNRRFYASVQALKAAVKIDGGVRSFTFEFTEWSHTIRPLIKAAGVKSNWLLGNSSHVIDLAFHLGGMPEVMCAFSGGELDWHPKAEFSGAGRSKTGALFAYHANWDAPGRWGVEVLTRERRLILRPLETLQVQKLASTAIEPVPIADELDKQFKAGLFEEVRAFFKENELQDCLCGLEEHLIHARIYELMLSGTPGGNAWDNAAA